jgi:hypothetical protein
MDNRGDRVSRAELIDGSEVVSLILCCFCCSFLSKLLGLVQLEGLDKVKTISNLIGS